MNKRGWHRIETGINISTSEAKGYTFFFDPKSKTKRVHAVINGEEIPICNGTAINDSCTIIEFGSKKYKESLCKNCARILLSMEDAQNDVVKRAKKTISRPDKTSKHKRLDSYQKALSKTKEDFQEAMVKANQNNIKLPEEIGCEEESLQEILRLATPIFTKIRQTAVLNLDRVMNEWRKLPANDTKEFTLIQQAQSLKQLIANIDQIKGFPK